MNIARKTSLILAFVFSLPINAMAEAPAAIVEQPAPQEMSSMHDLMRDMQRNQAPNKCKTMPGAAAEQDAPGPLPGMGMGPGMGGMQPQNCRMGPGIQGQNMACMQAHFRNCRMREGMDDKRMDMLEKRMDMMQMMLEMMLRQSAGQN
jgi:hypothetical protein